MLLCPRKIHHLRHFCFGDFITEYAANAHTLLMDVEHDSRGIFHAHPKKPLQTEDDEFHRCIIVIEHEDFVRRGLFRPRACSRRNAYASAAAIVILSFVCAKNLHR